MGTAMEVAGQLSVLSHFEASNAFRRAATPGSRTEGNKVPRRGEGGEQAPSVLGVLVPGRPSLKPHHPAGWCSSSVR